MTGGIRVIKLWRPGTSRLLRPAELTGRNEGRRLWVQRSIDALIEGSPHVSTNTTSKRYGSHAVNTCDPECFEAEIVAGLSPSRRMMVFGVHTLKGRTQ